MEQPQMTYGPYTPQETDRIASELKSLGIPFEINKDEEEEKKFSRSDYSNVVTRAEYRTESYLAQIFYFVIATKDEALFKQILERQNLAPKEMGAEAERSLDQVSAQEDELVKAGALAKSLKKRRTAQLLVILFILPLILLIINYWTGS